MEVNHEEAITRTYIAASVSGCAMTPQHRANFINGLNAINMGFQQRHYQQSPTDVFIQSQRAFRQPRIEVNNYYRRW